MKLSILALAACLSLAACKNTPDAEQAPATAPERSTELPAPVSTPKETAAAPDERVKPQVRYYEIADT